MDLTVDGKRAFAATGGRPLDPALPAVVFVHGAGMDHTVWALQTRYLAHHGHAVLAVDLPGHGRSGGPALDTVAALADWLIAAMDAAGLERAALVGHSMGALASLEGAARHGARVRALALLGVAPRMPVHPDLMAAAEADDPKAFELIVDWGHGGPAHRGGYPAPGVWVTGGGRRLLQRSAPGVLASDLAACAAYEDGLQAAAAVACPTLLLLGAEDRMTPARAGRKLAAAIAGAEARVLPGCGHMLMREAPDAVLDALDTVL